MLFYIVQMFYVEYIPRSIIRKAHSLVTEHSYYRGQMAHLDEVLQQVSIFKQISIAR